MEYAFDLSGGSTAVIKKYQVAATNTVIGVGYMKMADGNTGINLMTTVDARDFMGVNVGGARPAPPAPPSATNPPHPQPTPPPRACRHMLGKDGGPAPRPPGGRLAHPHPAAAGGGGARAPPTF